MFVGSFGYTIQHLIVRLEPSKTLKALLIHFNDYQAGMPMSAFIILNKVFEVRGQLQNIRYLRISDI